MRVTLSLLLVAIVSGCSSDRIPAAELRLDGPRGLWFAPTLNEHQRRGISVQLFLDDGVLANQPKLRAGDRVDFEGKKDRFEVNGTQIRQQIGTLDFTVSYASGTDDRGPWFSSSHRYRPLRRATREQLMRTWRRELDGGPLVLGADWSIDGYLLRCQAGAGLAGLTEDDALIFQQQLYRSTP